jgi:hypothetical protein
MTPGNTMAELQRAIDDLRRIVDEPPHYANLRDGGNLPAKPYRWTYAHTAGLILSGILLAVMAVILESVI